MPIILKPEQEKFIEAQVAHGKYKSPQEVVDRMFVIFERLQDDYEKWLENTRPKIEEGIESLDKGEGIDGQLVINRLRQRLHQNEKN